MSNMSMLNSSYVSISDEFKDLHLALNDYVNHAQGKYTISGTNHNGNTNGGNGMGHLNVSFSVASTDLKQRRLLRKVTLEVQSLGERCMTNGSEEYGSDLRHCNDDQQADKTLVCDLLSMLPRECRSTAIISPTTMTAKEMQNKPIGFSNPNPNTKGSIPSFPSTTIDLLQQVIESAHGLLLDEYNEIQQDCRTSANANGASISRPCVSSPISQMTPNPKLHSSRRHGSTHANGHSDKHVQASKQHLCISDDAKETIITALEFLTVAYGYCECQVVYSTLFQHGEGSNTRSGSGSGSRSGHEDQNGSCTTDILKALIYLFLNEVEPDTDENDLYINDDIPTLELTKLQTLALCTLVKALLCTEFIGRYCTSQTILPDTATYGCADTALGIDLGIRCLSSNRMRQALWKKALHTLCSSSPAPSRLYPLSHESTDSNAFNTSHQTIERLMGRFASMSIMGFFLRTLSRKDCYDNFFGGDGSSKNCTEVLKVLEKNVSKVSKQMSTSVTSGGSGSMRTSSSSSLTYSKMAFYTSSLSLLSMMNWKLPADCIGDRSVGGSYDYKVLHSLARIAFSSGSATDAIFTAPTPEDPDETVMNDDEGHNNDVMWRKMMKTTSTDVMIHLSISRNELLHEILDKDDIGTLVTNTLSDSALYQSRSHGRQSQHLHSQEELWETSLIHGELMFLLLHSKRSFHLQFRRWMDTSIRSIKVDEDPFSGGSEILLQNLLCYGKHDSFNISIASIMLMRSLLDVKMKTAQSSDSLACSLWNYLNGHTYLDSFWKQFFHTLHLFTNKRNHGSAEQNDVDVVLDTNEIGDMTVVHFSWQPWICACMDLIYLISHEEKTCKSLCAASFSNSHQGLKSLFSILRYPTQCNARYHEKGMIPSRSLVLYAIQLCTGSILCNMSAVGVNKTSMHSEIVSYMSKSKDYEPSPISVALGQTVSSDITRRALSLQSSVNAIPAMGTDSNIFVSNAVFASARMNQQQWAQTEQTISKHEEIQQRLSSENKQLQKEKDALIQNIERQNAFFQQEMTRLKMEAKYEAEERVAIEREEKDTAKRLLAQANCTIRDMKLEVQTTSERMKSEVAKRDEQISRLHESIKEQHESTESKLQSKDKRIEEAKRAIDKAKAKLHEEEEKRGTLKDKYLQLNEVYDRSQIDLEDAFFKLISIAKIYEVSNQERKSTESQLKDNLIQARKDVEHVRHRLESAEKTIEKMKRKESTSNRRKPMGAVDYESFRSRPQRKMSKKGFSRPSKFSIMK